MVLVDSSPLLPVTDPALLSRLTDTTLLIVAAGQTTKGHLRRASRTTRPGGRRASRDCVERSHRGGDDLYGRYSYSYTYEAQRAPPLPFPPTAMPMPAMQPGGPPRAASGAIRRAA